MLSTLVRVDGISLDLMIEQGSWYFEGLMSSMVMTTHL
jgi:hypothetical protein